MRRIAQGIPDREAVTRGTAGRGALMAFMWVVTLAAAVGGQTWEPQPDLGDERRLLAAAAVGGKIYTFGGCGSPCFHPTLHPSVLEETTVEVFEPGGGPPRTLGRLPAIFFGGAAAAVNGKIYLAGGFLTPNVLLEYDPGADSWRSRRPMPTPRFGLALVASGGKLYAVGGSGPTGALEIYDPATDSWAEGAAMPTPRVFLAAAALNGRIYAAGGSPDCCGASQTDVVEVYDPATNRWTAAASLPVAQQSSAAVATECRLYVFGGFVPGAGARGEVFEYDPETDRWSRGLPSLPTARDQAPAVLVDDYAYVLGGSVDCHCMALDANERIRLECDGDDGEPPGRADVAVTKTNRRNVLTPGEEVTYTIVVTNNGPGDADQILVRDDFRPKLRQVTWTCAGCVPNAGSDPLRCRVDLAVDESMTCTATGRLAGNATGRLCNTATVDSTGRYVDPDESNNEAEDCDPIQEPLPVPPLEADLAVTKTNGVDELSACSEMPPYTIVVTNRGPDPVTGARVEDDFPSELEDVKWTCASSPDARCGSAGGIGDLDEEVDLPVGGFVTYTVEGAVSDDAEGVLENTGKVSLPIDVDIMDPDPTNNTATDRDPLTRPFFLLFGKTNDVDVIPACVEVPLYEITVTNEGPCSTAARVTDEFADHLEGVTWTCAATPGSSCSPGGAGDVDDEIIVLRDGNVTYTVSGTVTVEAPPTLSNTACLSAPPDLELCSTHTDEVLKQADLEIAKTNHADDVRVCLPAPPYEIGVSNHGPCAVATARVTDAFPSELVEVAWSCAAGPGATCAGQGEGDLDEAVTLLAGASLTYTVTADVRQDASGDLVNTASVAVESLPDVIDPDLSNNSSTDSDPIGKRIADLAAEKATTSPVTAGEIVTYEILVTNAGPDPDEADATVIDPFAGELSGVEWTCEPEGDATCAPEGDGDVQDAVTLAPGASLTYATRGLLDELAEGELCNTVTVEPSICFEDPDLENNTFTVCDPIEPAITDCNGNGVPDEEDLADGTSDDVNVDGIPDECEDGFADWYYSGTASGGTVAVTFAALPGLFPACTVTIVTTAGDTSTTVAANIAAAINADACLAPRGVSAKTMGNSVWVSGFLLDQSQVSHTITDPTISVGVPIFKIPTLSTWGLVALILALAAAATRRLGRPTAR